MIATPRLAHLMEQTSADERLKPVHVALIVALCHLWTKNHFNKWYPITRKNLMALSRIHSNATYHKVINELQFYGYLQYHPSYHPRQGTRVSIVIPSQHQTETNYVEQ